MGELATTLAVGEVRDEGLDVVLAQAEPTKARRRFRSVHCYEMTVSALRI